MKDAIGLGVLLLALLGATGCNGMPGEPPPGPEVPRPSQVLDSHVLYLQNCSGCHGVQGVYGPATPLANPEYQALVSDEILRGTIMHGQTGSLMPGFARSEGGTLTDQQIDSIIKGMRQHWYKGPVLGANAPPYQAKGPGDAHAGEAVYESHCAMCHGDAPGQMGAPGSKGARADQSQQREETKRQVPTGGEKATPGYAGPLVNPSLLALITPQAIRTTVIVGRPDLGMPDWRDEPGDPLSDADITNVVAFLEAQRPAKPGEVFGPPNQLPAVSRHVQPQSHPPATNRSKGTK
jgi:cytochrome c oxidase cbb3-type subunit 3